MTQAKRYLFSHSWSFPYAPRQRVDAMVADAVRMHCTDLMVAVNCWFTDGPPMLIGDSAYMQSRPERIGTQTMMEYLIDGAHAAGLDVYAVFIVGMASAWKALTGGLPSQWTTSSLTDPACADVYEWMLLYRDDVRQMVIDTLVDFIGRHDIDGVGLDFFRYQGRLNCAQMTEDDLNAILTDLQAQAYCEVVPFCGYTDSTSGPTNPQPLNRQNADYWLEQGLVDAVAVMGYNLPFVWRQQWPPLFPGPVLMGVGQGGAGFGTEVAYWTTQGQSHFVFAWPQMSAADMDAVASVQLEDTMDVIDHLNTARAEFVAAEAALRSGGLVQEADRVAAEMIAPLDVMITDFLARDDVLDAQARIIKDD